MPRVSNYKLPVRGQSGLSLLEVLIAIAVLAIGLLGLAHMQSFGMLNIERAYQRSQATLLAYAIADKMRAHVGLPTDSTANLGRYLSSFMAPEDASAKPNCKSTTGCSADDMAENDLFEWNQALTTQLPQASGTISLVNENYIVAIVWDDNGDGAVGQDDPVFSMSFQP
jgi:type IV pilus assembly protein PilV